MWRWIWPDVGGLLFAAIALWALLLVTLRTKFSPALTAIRSMNRMVWNRRAMSTAGRPGAYASVIHHVGRTTGTPYGTPVGVVDTGDGFVIGLPYGTSPDWLKNMLATGTATIVSEGSAYRVEDPELVTAADANRHFSDREQRSHRLYGVDQFLFLRRSGSEAVDGRP
jgi:deazaflavin-dependent oxidoreductase (nitroreductase family)